MEKLNTLLKEVTKMREHQKDFFKYRKVNDLHESKRYEKIVDNLIEEINSHQIKLFND